MNNKIFILVTKTDTIISNLIGLYTRVPYNHASITADKSFNTLYSFSRYNVNTPLPAGFNTESIHTCIYGLRKHIPCEIYEITITDKQMEMYERLIENFRQNINLYRFNCMGFLGAILRIPIKRRYKMLCSQFVSYILEECNIYTFSKSRFLVTPDDLRYIASAKLVYKGDLKNYYRLKNNISSTHLNAI